MMFQFHSVQLLSRVQLFVTPWTAACQASLSITNSWSLLKLMLPCPPPGNLSNPSIELRSLALQADSLPSEPPGKPKNTGVGSLSLLQGIFLTQQSNPRGLLHSRQYSLPAELPGKTLMLLKFYGEQNKTKHTLVYKGLWQKTTLELSPLNCSILGRSILQ